MDAPQRGRVRLDGIGDSEVPFPQELDHDDLQLLVGKLAGGTGVVAVTPGQGVGRDGGEEMLAFLAGHLAETVKSEPVKYVRWLVLGWVVLG